MAFSSSFLAAFIGLLLVGLLSGLASRKFGALVGSVLGALMMVGALSEGSLSVATAYLLGTLGAAGVLVHRARKGSPGRGESKRSGGEIEMVPLTPGGTVHVVGESHYQNALTRIAGGRRSQSARIEVVAALLAEPNNRFDPNAIAVRVSGHLVGYLSRADAVAFKPLIAPIAAAGKVASCHAIIVGGWDRGRRGKGSFGIQLKLARPGETQHADSRA